MPASQLIDLSKLRIGALLNTSSGSCDIGSEHELEAILGEAECRLEKLWCGGSEAVGSALSEVDGHALDVLIVLGGDGTIRSAAQSCSSDGPYLVPLPGGTMNMLPKALYGDGKWQEVLRAVLETPCEQPVNGGRIGKEKFFIAAILGSPSLWAEAREALRDKDIGGALKEGLEAFKKAFNTPLHYASDAQSGEAEAVSVLCPLTSSAMDDEERSLEVAALTPSGALDAAKLAMRAATSDWRSDPNVSTYKANRIELRSDQPIPAILDGETVELGMRATVEFVPTAFKALVPADTR